MEENGEYFYFIKEKEEWKKTIFHFWEMGSSHYKVGRYKIIKIFYSIMKLAIQLLKNFNLAQYNYFNTSLY